MVERGPSTSLLTATGTTVLLARCAAVVLVAVTAVVVAPVLMYRGDAVWPVGLFLGGTLVLLASVIYALRRTCCPRCKTRWLQYALGEKSVKGWLTWLITFRECPECGLCAQDVARSLQPRK